MSIRLRLKSSSASLFYGLGLLQEDLLIWQLPKPTGIYCTSERIGLDPEPYCHLHHSSTLAEAFFHFTALPFGTRCILTLWKMLVMQDWKQVVPEEPDLQWRISHTMKNDLAQVESRIQAFDSQTEQSALPSASLMNNATIKEGTCYARL